MVLQIRVDDFHCYCQCWSNAWNRSCLSNMWGHPQILRLAGELSTKHTDFVSKIRTLYQIFIKLMIMFSRRFIPGGAWDCCGAFSGLSWFRMTPKTTDGWAKLRKKKWLKIGRDSLRVSRDLWLKCSRSSPHQRFGSALWMTLVPRWRSTLSPSRVPLSSRSFLARTYQR